MKYTKEESKEILDAHKLWSESEGGRRAYLRGAYLQGADLRGADLRGAYLRGADLQGAYLQGAYLQGADLRGADLRGAYLNDNQISLIISFTQIVPTEGEFIAYKWGKRSDNGEKIILVIKVPARAKRLSHIASRKCRASHIEIFRAETFDGKIVEDCPEFTNWNDDYPTKYKVGEKYEVDDFNSDVRVDCAAGYHFFMTKEEVMRWG